MLAWQAACDVFVTRFLADLKLGSPPERIAMCRLCRPGLKNGITGAFSTKGSLKSCSGLGTAGPGHLDMIFGLGRDGIPYGPRRLDIDWPELLGQGLIRCRQRCGRRGGRGAGVRSPRNMISAPCPAMPANLVHQQLPAARLAGAAFKIIDDPLLCSRMQISVAAVDDELQEIYVNPAVGYGRYRKSASSWRMKCCTPGCATRPAAGPRSVPVERGLRLRDQRLAGGDGPGRAAPVWRAV